MSAFEDAADAIVTGNFSSLEQLLKGDPQLIHARSDRPHRCTLLHYVGANGFEDFRQRTPPNAVQIAECLLAAGAEVNAVADLYGGSSTLDLVATSVHPQRVGVQLALIDLLLTHGALMNTRLVNSCLANGRIEAATHLAKRGAPLDLEGAAGVGDLEKVASFFLPDGSLQPSATPTQMRDGFTWACEYGKTPVVAFLLDRGIEVGMILPRPHGQTGLHWAAHGAHLETVRLLLARGAPVHIKDQHWGATPLEWAHHGRDETPPESRGQFDEVIALLVDAEGKPSGLQRPS